MSNQLTLKLSEIAGHCEVSVSAADTADTIGDKIVTAFQSAKPLALSEREAGLVRDNRETKIEILAEQGLSPAIKNRLVMEFCGDLSLSEDNSTFDLVLSLVSDVLRQKHIDFTEKTKAQALKRPDPLSLDESWAERTKSMKPVG